jgi:hypothetical protein
MIHLGTRLAHAGPPAKVKAKKVKKFARHRVPFVFQGIMPIHGEFVNPKTTRVMDVNTF